jgi:histidyl-tRNA synthetase
MASRSFAFDLRECLPTPTEVAGSTARAARLRRVTAFRAPRGTRDLLPAERAAFRRLETVATDLARRYGYREIETPLLEQAAVFERGVGEVTDVVEKELFRLAPRNEESESWALRPEPTAGIVRAYIQHGMQTLPQPVKLTMTGPMFRYDRPQAGRYREFWQFDVEAIGDPGPAIDAELIELAFRFYSEVGLSGLELRLNSIGDQACRPAYVEELTAYYRAQADRLPALERDRLERNVLRLLDSKDPAMVELNATAPKITDRLCDACAEHFAGVRAHLDALGIEYALDPALVRGLDYYTRTTFEFFPLGSVGQQSALGGGGRYDGLVELLGGRPTPGIGFGVGLDRVLLALEAERIAVPAEAGPVAVVVGADPAATAERLRVATALRAAGLAVRADLGHRKLGRQLEAASKEGAHFAIILGDELADGQVQLKDLQAGTQRLVGTADLERELTRASASHRHG